MAYIAREDGQHFVIPAYRDTLAVKQKSALKNEILLLSQSYGEFITLQEKGANQYEVAFSSDTGYLLGESIWHYFKRPLDMIYCEAIPNTTEALLVIVKAGSVYLDGRFPIESIPEELIIFLTQQNNFEIYTHGDVPISKTAEEGKFSFEETSVKSFNIVDTAIFPTLPLYKIYQLQLVDAVLKTHRIGVLPLRPILLAVVTFGLLWFVYSYIISHKEIVPRMAPAKVNPYQGYFTALNTPAPEEEIGEFIRHYRLLFTLPGWAPDTVDYVKGSMNIAMKSFGGRVLDLLAWGERNNLQVNVTKEGLFVADDTFTLTKRPPTNEIYPINQVIATFVDRLAKVYPGNNMTLGEFSKKDVYKEVFITINVQNASPMLLAVIAQQVSGLPVVLQSINMTVNNGILTGTIILQALGN